MGMLSGLGWRVGSKTVSEPQYVYLADFHDGEPQLTRVEIVNQNSKTYLTRQKSAGDILGNIPIVPIVISKEYVSVFDSILKALSYLHDAATAHVHLCQQKTAKARSQVASIEQLIEEAKQANE